MALFTTNTTAQPLPPFARVAFVVAETVLAWEIRRQTRRRLSLLDTHILKDIGLNAADAQAEAEKPFWRN